MDANRPPAESRRDPPAEARLQALLDLKEQLQQLHAELEFVRLMLKLRPQR